MNDTILCSVRTRALEIITYNEFTEELSAVEGAGTLLVLGTVVRVV